ncbi:internalin N-terminal domain-containing protein [Listeria seeligeri]|uniref:internalin N-terminal domain-containing protein n=1 Tax=Listeria seeligeri TaxID=1640 RepID=UPI0018897C92|nr:internalin N-terminal domain-containing protein [Listeria seeligeri]MBF2481458.1 internalin N-terminal domain-containing protein [Listeria seeligeri]
MKKILTSLSFALLLIVLLLNFSGGDIKARAASELYPLPAPIIEVFPDDGLAKDMAKNLNKDSVDDVIDQEDLDGLTGLGFETETITNDSLKLLERAMFNNVESANIMEFGEGLTEFPDVTTIPHLTSIYYAVPPAGISRSLSLPDYQNYPEMESITMSQHPLIGSIPDFTGMPKLKHLYMGDMSITSDDVPDFQHIPELRTLELGLNDLTDTIVNFTNLPRLNYLDLDYNHLNELPTNVLDAVFVQNQTNTLPDQTINQGETSTIELPIYYQMESIGMLINTEVYGQYIDDFNHVLPVTLDETTNSMTLDTSSLSPGVYKVNVNFNAMSYPVTQESCYYDWVVTIN